MTHRDSDTQAMTEVRVRGWRVGLAGWLAMGIAVFLLAVAYWAAFEELLFRWETIQEYSHGYFIPLIALFLAWQKKNELAELPFAGSGWGLVLLVLGVLLYALGTLSTIFVVVHYSLLVVLTGLVLTLLGWRGLGLLWPALLVLVFMIPLPNFIYQQLSGKLQLISSEIGVVIIRALGMSVYLEGNIIDLGAMKLQVVEACNGLRYLFPLMSFGFLAAYFQVFLEAGERRGAKPPRVAVVAGAGAVRAELVRLQLAKLLLTMGGLIVVEQRSGRTAVPVS